MAAVAGTKGKVCLESKSATSLQLEILNGLLDHSLDFKIAGQKIAQNARLREIGVDTNMACNLACSYCYLSDRHESKGTLDLELLENYLKGKIVEGAKLIAFIGKEPLLDDRAVTLIKRLQRLSGHHSFRTGMVTNGTLVEKRLEKLIDANPSYLDISIDGGREVNDALRGKGAHEKALRGINLIIDSPLKKSLSTTTVLWNRSIEGFISHVDNMFEIGVETCFGSPVLNFAVGNNSQDVAITLDVINQYIERISKAFPSSPKSNQQIMIDLPYRYTWMMLKSGGVPIKEVFEDRFEALFWQVPGSRLVVKLNPFSYSYFRALRVTHDGTVIENMDLAAHQNYLEGTHNIVENSASTFCNEGFKDMSTEFHNHFLSNHVDHADAFSIFDRALEKQNLENLKRVRSVTTRHVV